MPLPPKEVPDGLTSKDYKRLGALYMLMGCQKQAVEALTRSSEMRRALVSVEDAQQCKDLESDGAMTESLKFSLNLAKLWRKAATDLDEKEADGDADAEAEIRKQLVALGVPESEVDQYLSKLLQSMAELKNSDPPPLDVPEGLTAAEYYELGLKYKEIGWTEQARDALAFAIEIEPDGDSGKLAASYLRTKIPRHPVPLVAEQSNIHGFNQFCSGDEAGAQETFEALIAEYPDFEWPYGNLGCLFIQLGEVTKAKKILRKAIEINPHYVNAWLHMARAEALDENYEEAYGCLSRVEEIDSDETSISGIKKLVDEIAAAD
ncbi:MAG: tetratricopeptide repeat protein [Candidatus Melainabacteria bacterium]|jgi:tetratricopeptide (TPR) repeat protein|nr:tetratricopeptide repeat protein [Candidatus Melainabacteria bacterium]